MPEEAGPLSHDVHWLMARLARSLGAVEQESLGPFGITLREHVVMVEVAAQSPRSQLAVAKAAAVDKSLMVKAVDRLEQLGLLVREPHPTDRRVRTLALTEEGRRTLVETAAAVQNAEALLLSGLPAGRRAAFVASLRDLARIAPDFGFDTSCA